MPPNFPRIFHFGALLATGGQTFLFPALFIVFWEMAVNFATPPKIKKYTHRKQPSLQFSVLFYQGNTERKCKHVIKQYTIAANVTLGKLTVDCI